MSPREIIDLESDPTNMRVCSSNSSRKISRSAYVAVLSTSHILYTLTNGKLHTTIYQPYGIGSSLRRVRSLLAGCFGAWHSVQPAGPRQRGLGGSSRPRAPASSQQRAAEESRGTRPAKLDVVAVTGKARRENTAGEQEAEAAVHPLQNAEGEGGGRMLYLPGDHPQR